jgi:hypothetical protein
VTESDAAGLRALREEGRLKRFIIVCREERPQLRAGIEILPWRQFLDSLWEGTILGGG